MSNSRCGIRIFTRATCFLLFALISTSCVLTSSSKVRNSESRAAYFGDLHVHTAFSFDAYMGRGNRVTPDMAFRFARGEPIDVFGHTIRRAWPLDFLAVTDHSENLGVASTIEDPDSKLSRTEPGHQLRSITNYQTALPVILKLYGVQIDPETSATAWAEEVAAANRNYEPKVFTSLIGFEWASGDIHRNVIFAGATAPLPFTTLQSKREQDLWAYMEAARADGMDSIAITNHPVGSKGRVFALEDSSGRPIDRDYAIRRNRNERLVEMVNTNTEQESTPVVSPADPFLGLRRPGETEGPGGTVRGGLGRGLAVRDDLGVNPFQVGFVGSSDTHIGLSISGPAAFTLSDLTGAAVSPSGATGHYSVLNGNGRIWLDNFDVLPGPLTGVWAEKNTRLAIFAALKRRETFATSGPRIKVRFFGGWTYRSAPELHRNWMDDAYADGTPMGGVLPPRPRRAAAPRFLIWAQPAPDGEVLTLAQVVKLSYADARMHERIFDVTPAPYDRPSDDGVLAALWEDPEFNPGIPAAYYLRVLETPTRRWTTIFGKYLRLNPPPGATATTQQRAWSSPIWYCGDGSTKARDGVSEQ